MENNFDSRSQSKELSWERHDDNRREESQSKHRESREQKPDRESFEKRKDKFYKKSSRENSAENTEQTCLYLSNLGTRINPEHFEELLKKYGNVKNVNIIKHPHTGECRGFAFVSYETKEHTNAALQGLNGLDYEGKKIVAEVSKRSKGRASTPGMYLGPSNAKKPRYGQGFKPRYRSRSDSRRRYRYDDRDRRPYREQRYQRGGDYRETRDRDPRDYRENRENRDYRERDPRDTRDYRGEQRNYRERSHDYRNRSRSYEDRRRY